MANENVIRKNVITCYLLVYEYDVIVHNQNANAFSSDRYFNGPNMKSYIIDFFYPRVYRSRHYFEFFAFSFTNIIVLSMCGCRKHIVNKPCKSLRRFFYLRDFLTICFSGEEGYDVMILEVMFDYLECKMMGNSLYPFHFAL